MPVHHECASCAIEIDSLAGERRFESAAEHEVLRRPRFQLTAHRKEPDAIGRPESELKIVCSQQNGTAGLAYDTPEKAHRIDPAREVQECSDLVQDQQPRLLSQGASHHDPLPLSVAQVAHESMRQVLCPNPLDALPDDLAVMLGQPSGPTGVRVTTEPNEGIRGEETGLHLLG